MRPSELLLLILRICDEEGEDIEFGEILRILRARLGIDPPAELLGLSELPPRVALARLAKDPRWAAHLREASAAFVEEKLKEAGPRNANKRPRG